MVKQFVKNHVGKLEFAQVKKRLFGKRLGTEWVKVIWGILQSLRESLPIYFTEKESLPIYITIQIHF